VIFTEYDIHDIVFSFAKNIVATDGMYAYIDSIPVVFTPVG